jgi:hypothetical protein
MQNVPLDAVLLFDLHAAILGWLLSVVQPKKQHPWHKIDIFSKVNPSCVSYHYRLLNSQC